MNKSLVAIGLPGRSVAMALTGAVGHVFDRARRDVAKTRVDHDIAAFRTGIKALESKAVHASGAAKTRLLAWSLTKEALTA